MDFWTILAILILIAVVIVRFKYENWMAQKNDRIVKELFIQAGADRPYSACRLEDLGLKLKFWSFGFRNFKNEAVKRLIIMEEIKPVGDGRFYLVPDTDPFDRNPRK